MKLRKIYYLIILLVVASLIMFYTSFQLGIYVLERKDFIQYWDLFELYGYAGALAGLGFAALVSGMLILAWDYVKSLPSSS